MPFLTALDSTDYDNLRGTSSIPPTYAAAQYMCLGSNTVVFEARVNQTTFATSFASVNYDTVTVGSYSDIEEGMTVLISHTDDQRAAFFVGRVRANNVGVVATSTLVGLNETSAAVANNDYLWVLNDYRMYHKLGRESGGVYYKDYGKQFTELKPLIYGLQSAYAGVVSGSPTGYTVSFAPTAVAATSGATISSYAWTLPSGTTVTAGSTSAANVTVRFDASASEYWVKLVVTDSGSRTQTRHIPVFAIPADLSTTIARGFNGASITNDIDTGTGGSIEAFDGVDDVLDNTLAVIFNVEYYNGAAYNVNGNIALVGRLRKETNRTDTDEKYGQISSTTFELETVAGQLARLSAPYVTMQDSSSPTAWDQVRKLTVWRGIVYMLEHSTFHELHSLSFDSTADTFLAYQLEVDQGNQFDSVKSLAQAINAVMEFAPSGEVKIARSAWVLGTSARNALTTVADFTTQDAVGWSIERDHVETVGLVEASGGTYARTGMGITGNAVIPLLSIAPGTAQGNADGVTTLSRQILAGDVSTGTAQSELNVRTGHQYARENDTITLSVDMLDGYHWLIPSVSQWYTWTIDATDNTRGLAYTTSERWLLKSVEVTHDNEAGSKTVTASFISETSGAAGQTQLYPPLENTPPVLPTIPAIPAYPNFPPDTGIYLPDTPTLPTLPPFTNIGSGAVNAIPTNGSAVVIWNPDEAWTTKDFIGVPKWLSVTPLGLEGTVRDVALVGTGAYLLSSDGDNSWVYYTSNVFTAGGAWNDATRLIGEYTRVVPASTLGAVYVLSNSGTSTVDTLTIDMTTATLTETTLSTNLGQSYLLTFTGTWVYDTSTSDRNGDAVYTQIAPGEPWTQDDIAIQYEDGTFLSNEWSGGYQSTHEYTVFRAGTGSKFGFKARDPNLVDNSGSITVLIESVSVNDMQTRYSTDYGATFGTLKAVGISPANGGGMDTVKVGTVALAGAEGQVVKATSGGTWAAYGSALVTDFEPTAIFIPRYQFGSTSSSNASSTPQYLVASAVEDTDGETMYKVTGSGTVFTAITPTVSGDKGLALGPNCVWQPWWSGAIIFAVLDFGGSPRLVISTNSGASWTDKGILDDDALSVIGRKGDKTMQQLFLTNGTPAYSKNRGTSIVSKSFPADAATDPVKGIQVYG